MFPTTRLSALAADRSADPAVRELGFSRIAEAYWKPVYLYLRLQHGRSAEDASDLTQDIFARAWERETFRSYDPAKGRFRTFVRTCLDHFAANERVAAARIKRGGAMQRVAFDFDAAESEMRHHAAAPSDPEELFARELVRALMQQALEDLRVRNAERFAIFEAYELSDDDQVSYADLARRFALPVTSITNALAAARRDLRRLLLDRLRAVTATDDEFRSEARRIFGQ